MELAVADPFGTTDTQAAVEQIVRRLYHWKSPMPAMVFVNYWCVRDGWEGMETTRSNLLEILTEMILRFLTAHPLCFFARRPSQGQLARRPSPECVLHPTRTPHPIPAPSLPPRLPSLAVTVTPPHTLFGPPVPIPQPGSRSRSSARGTPPSGAPLRRSCCAWRSTTTYPSSASRTRCWSRTSR